MEKFRILVQENKAKKWTTTHVDWLFAILFAIGVFAFTALTCTPRSFTDDDWGIANYFAGVMGADYATPYNKFINFILGWIMYGMYQFLPGPNWFIIVQELIVAFSFAMLHYMLIQKMKNYLSTGWCYLIASVFVLSFEPSYLSRVQFTQTAVIGSIVGIYWMIFCHKNNLSRGFILGTGFTVLSALFRFGSFEICLPFAGLCLLDHFIGRMEGEHSFRKLLYCFKKDRMLYFTIMGIIIACFTVSRINNSIYNSDYYSKYNEFNAARASVLDYPTAAYEDIAEKLEEIGVSENDYDLIISWTVADLSFITTDLLKAIAAIQPKINGGIDCGTKVAAYFTNLLDPTIMYNKLFYFTLIILLVCLILDFKHMKWYVMLLLLGAIVIELYFEVVVMRYPPYVRTGLLFAVITTALIMTDFSRIFVLQGRWYAILAVFLTAIYLLAPLGNDYYLKTKGTFEYNMDGLAMYEYMNGREDDIFMIPTGDNGGLPALRNSYSIFKETKPGIMRHTVGLGGWSTNNPWVNEAYHAWGIDYPLSQAADENVYLLASQEKVNSIRQYLLEHRNKQTTASLTAIEYGTTIYKVTDRNMEVIDSEFALIHKVFAEYDSDYNTYDISIDLDLYGLEDNYRVFIVLEDSGGGLGYYMVYEGHDVSLAEGNVRFVAKIPSGMLLSERTYKANIMLQGTNGNYRNSSDFAKVKIPAFE